MRSNGSGLVLRGACAVAAGAAAVVALCGANGCPTDPIGFCEARVKARCELAFRCCEDDERLDPKNSGALLVGGLTYTNSEGECVDRVTSICDGSFFGGRTANDAIGLGRARWNGDGAQQCIDALNKARDACDLGAFNEAELADECNGLIEGVVEDGDECANSFECKDGGFCDFGPDPGDPDVDFDIAAVEGSCIAPAQEGDACSERACIAGTFCDFFNTITCKAIPGEGDPCPELVCDDGDFCDDTDGTCKEQIADGGACDPNSFSPQCAGGGFCDTAQTPPVCDGGIGAEEPAEICTGRG